MGKSFDKVDGSFGKTAGIAGGNTSNVGGNDVKISNQLDSENLDIREEE